MPVLEPSSVWPKYSLYWSMALMELKMDYSVVSATAHCFHITARYSHHQIPTPWH